MRRTVAFAEAVYEGSTAVEGIAGVRADGAADAPSASLDGDVIPVVVDPEATIRHELEPALLVDAIVAKRNLGTRIDDAPAVVALGPGFVAGRDAHAVIETKRGHTLGRVLFEGAALPNTGVPGEVGGYTAERLLRAPCDGVFLADARDRRHGRRGRGRRLGRPACPSATRLGGVLRGLLSSGLEVTEGFKLGDVDPRASREHCFLVSDKALAIAGGVLEAACALLGGVRFEHTRVDCDPFPGVSAELTRRVQ